MNKKKKFQSGAASVLDDPDILDVIPQIRRPNLMGDPTKLGAADLGPLLAMMAAGAYPAVSAMTEKDKDPQISPIIKTPAGDVYAPSEEEIRKRQAEDAERAKNTGLVPPDVKNEPLITPTPKPKGLLDDANITLPSPQEDNCPTFFSNRRLP